MEAKKKQEPIFVSLNKLGDIINVQVRQSSRAKRISLKYVTKKLN